MGDAVASDRGTPKVRQVLITGATSGIGKAISEELLARGYEVLGLGRRAGVAPLAADGFRGLALDLSDLESLPGRLEDLAREFPEIDAVVLSAGRGMLGGLEQASYRQIRDLIDLDLTSQIFVARAFLPRLKRRGRGDLVFMGSEAALAGSRNGSVYCAAKFALRGLALSLRDECARSGVRVSIVHPGVVRTPFFDDLPIAPGTEPGEALEPGDVAAAVAFLLTQPPGMVIDELSLSPLKKKIWFKNRSR